MVKRLKKEKPKLRPPRVFKTKKGRFYIIVKNKIVYIPIPKDLDASSKQVQNQLVKVIINNGQYRTKTRPRKKPEKKQIYFQSDFFPHAISSDFGYHSTRWDRPRKEQFEYISTKPPKIYPTVSEQPEPEIAEPEIMEPETPKERNFATDVFNIHHSAKKQVSFSNQKEKDYRLFARNLSYIFPTELQGKLKDNDLLSNSKAILKEEADRNLFYRMAPHIDEYRALVDKYPELSPEEKAHTIKETISRRFTPKGPFSESKGRKIHRETPPSSPLREEEEEGEPGIRNGMGKYSHWKAGLYDSEIHSLMKKKLNNCFVPVIMCDEIPTLLKYVDSDTEEFGFIINSTSSKTDGEHWRSIFISIPRGEIDYYDSLVSEPSQEFLKDIKLLIDKISPNQYLKLKVNKIKEQSDNTNNCGFFAMAFLVKMFKGKKFKDSTMTQNSDFGEKQIEKFKTYL